VKRVAHRLSLRCISVNLFVELTPLSLVSEREMKVAKEALRKTHTMDGHPQNPSKSQRTPKPAKTLRQQHFVRNLRWAIERLGLTLRALSDQAGVDEMWLRRAATQGIKWTKSSTQRIERTKSSGTEAVKKLEEFLGCPPGTLWEPDGVRFRAGVAGKHLSGRDMVSNFEAVLSHFEGNPPPLLSRAIEIIDYLRKSIDDPNLEPPPSQQTQTQSKEGVVIWDRSGSCSFSEEGLARLMENVNIFTTKLEYIGVHHSSEVQMGRKDLERVIGDYDFSDFGVFLWMGLYAAKLNISAEDVERLIERSQAIFDARLAEEAEQEARESEERQESGNLSLLARRISARRKVSQGESTP
jgi:hypothetical protein